MPTTTVTSPIASAAAQQLWSELTRLFREACVLRRQGRHNAAAAILEKQLPAMIRGWAAESRLSANAAKARLQEMFSDEQARVESAWLISRFSAESPVTAAAAAPLAQPAARPAAAWYPPISPRRIPIDDVVGMIDMVREHERLAVA